MAKTPNRKEAPADLDELINNDQGEAPDAEVSIAPEAESFDDLLAVSENESVELTPDQKRIQELEALLAEPEDDAEEIEFEELTPEQKRIQELEAQIAARHAKKLAADPVKYAPPAEKGTLINVLADGFNQFGQVWFRGQEILIDDLAYERTKDRLGNSWMDTLLHDPHAQFQAWGTVFVAPGPFKPRPGEVFQDALAKEDERRKRSVPARPRD